MIKFCTAAIQEQKGVQVADFRYYHRLADEELEQRLSRSGAVVIRGAKWCGKTETALQHSSSVLYLQDPDEYENNMLTAQTKPSLLLRGDQPRLIDEWQDAPQIWDAVRFAIDKEHGFGHYILTGSVSKELELSERPRHSGTGRISPMTMRPMSLWESLDSNGSVSLRALFDNPQDAGGTCSCDVERIAYLVCRGGWPEVVAGGLDGIATSRDYVKSIAYEDISRVDGVQRNPECALLLMAAYARCLSTQADLATIRKNIKARQGELSRNTVSAYVASLRKLYVFEDLPAWKPSLRDKTRVTATPKRHFVDPSLAAAALGATPDMLLRDMPTLGMLFESLCVRDLRIYAESLGGSLYHYHDDAGREADAVIAMPDGRWALVEMKMGHAGVEEGAEGLLGLAEKIDVTVMGEPSFLAVMAPTAYSHQRDDGVLVVSPACLKA